MRGSPIILVMQGRKNTSLRKFVYLFGLAVGILALFFTLKNIHWEVFSLNLKKMSLLWLFPIISLNFVIFWFKAKRWQIVFRPVQPLSMMTMYKTVVAGYMASNLFPARLGEVVTVYYLNKKTKVSRVTVAGTLFAERIVDWLSFLLLTTVLIFFVDVPPWLRLGVTTIWGLTIFLYVFSLFYLRKNPSKIFFQKWQSGIQSLRSSRLTFFSLIVSLGGWFFQALMVYWIHLAFSLTLPLWSVVLILVSVHLAMAIPTTPAQIGVFEYACLLAYSFLGIDANMGTVLGFMYHFLQVIPNLLLGFLFFIPVKTILRERSDE